jgi:hypothetical protein
MMADEPHSVGDVLDKLRELAEQGEVQVGHMAEAFGGRSHGPFLLVPALIEMSPIGGIPGLPTVLAALIALFAAQMVIGREHLWLPGFIARRTLSADKVKRAADKLRGVARFLDRHFHGRLPAFTSGPAQRAAGAAVILLCLTVPPLELLPFASTAPMAAIAAFGLAIMVRDGLLMLAAFALSLAAVAIGLGLWSSGSGSGAGGRGG